MLCERIKLVSWEFDALSTIKALSMHNRRAKEAQPEA
jgi:hypothetical protein